MPQDVSAEELCRRGSIIRRAREARCWTISRLAREARVDRAQVSKIEVGKAGESLPGVLELARVLNIDLNLLFRQEAVRGGGVCIAHTSGDALQNEPTGV
jgi:transcriptional regulator with XRE-family HTH domain